MKKNKTILMLTVALAIVLSSCVGAGIYQKDDFVAKFTAGETTRALGSSWTAGDLIGVTMLDGTGTSVVGTYQNLKYKAKESTTNTVFEAMSGEIYLIYDRMVFSAYYPYNESYTSTLSMPINTEYTSTTKYNDIMFTSRIWEEYSPTTIALDFKYKMAKVKIKLIQGAGSPVIYPLSLSIVHGIFKADMNLKTGLVTLGSMYDGDICYFAETDVQNEYYALLIPQTLPANAYINIGSDFGGGNIPIGNTVFDAKEYSYTITINKDNVKLASGVEITDREKTTDVPKNIVW